MRQLQAKIMWVWNHMWIPTTGLYTIHCFDQAGEWILTFPHECLLYVNVAATMQIVWGVNMWLPWRIDWATVKEKSYTRAAASNDLGSLLSGVGSKRTKKKSTSWQEYSASWPHGSSVSLVRSRSSLCKGSSLVCVVCSQSPAKSQASNVLGVTNLIGTLPSILQHAFKCCSN